MKVLYRLSDFLLELYRNAQELTATEFEDSVLHRLRDYLAFDGAHWAITTGAATAPSQSPPSRLITLPPTPHAPALQFEAALSRQFNAARPGATVRLQAARLGDWFGHHNDWRPQGVEEALHTVAPASRPGVYHSICLHRSAVGFGEEERRFKEAATPHLVAAWEANSRVQLDQLLHKPRLDQRHGLALADPHGFTLNAQPHFQTLLEREWPDWDEPQLPAPLRSLLKEDGGEWLGSQLAARVHHCNGLRLLALRGRSRLDRLTPRESQAAEAFARGASYKEVARQLEVAPTTARHYLRTAYAKLNVSDKAELAQLLSGHGRA